MSKTRRRDKDGVYHRPDSPYYWASFIDASGKRARRSTGAESRKEAEAILAKWRVEVREQKHWGAKPERSFEEMILIYLKEGSSQKRSAASDRRSARRLLKHFTGANVYDLSVADRRGYVSQRKSDGVSNATINRELSMLSMSIKHVNSEHDWEVVNICSGGRLKEEQTAFRWLTQKEAAALTAAAASEPKAIGLADFVVVSLNTGMRVHELLHDVVEGVEVGLTWDRVDLQQNLIYLRSRDQKNGLVGSVPLNARAREAILSRAGFRATHCPSARYVFCGADGIPIKSMKRSFSTACRRAGIKDCTVHTLRHTCASWLVQRGVPLVKVKELLRHADIKTTMRYAHLAPADSREAAAALESRFSHVTGDKKNTSEYKTSNSLILFEYMAPRDGLEPPTQ